MFRGVTREFRARVIGIKINPVIRIKVIHKIIIMLEIRIRLIIYQARNSGKLKCAKVSLKELVQKNSVVMLILKKN
jgi:hypothetical protein